jgi:O-antigen/teichoic acid export membrane protein
LIRAFQERYGAGPLHLLGVLASFVVTAYAFSRALNLTGHPDRVLLWFGGSIVAHDALLLPLYALLGAIALVAITGLRADPSRLRIAALNHLRFPALCSGVLLLVWYPVVAGPAARGFMRTTGLSKDVYFDRWLLLTAALFLGSAVLFAARVPRLRRQA